MAVTLPVRGTPNWDISLNAALTYLDNNNTSSSSNALQRANNLSDLTNVPVARANLNLTGLANALSNMTATTNPGVGSDNTQGYTIGSTWFNTSTNAVFIASNVATGAAVWMQIPPTYVDLTSAQTVAGIKTFSANIIGSAAARIGTTVTVGQTSSLGDNGVGELQLANATTVPTTNPTGGAVVYSQAGIVKTRNPQGLVITGAGSVQSQITTNTVSTTGLQAISSFTVPANDIAIGTVYEIVGHGVFTTGVTATTIGMGLYWNGTAGTAIAVLGTAPTITASLTNALFNFRGFMTFRSPTSAVGYLTMTLATSTTTGAANTYVMTSTAPVSITTTANSALAVGINFNNAQSMSLLGGYVTRLA